MTLQGGTRRRARGRLATALFVAVFGAALALAGLVAVTLLAGGGGRHGAGSGLPLSGRGGESGGAGAGADPHAASAPRAHAYGRTADAVQVRLRFHKPPRAGLLVDERSGRVLWRIGSERRLPIASLTKMMTALLTVEHEPPQATVAISRMAIDAPGSRVGMLPHGRRVPVETLLYGLLLPSGNDAAYALAQKVAGTPSAFVGLMNARARQLGLTCSRFASPSGYVDQGNYACAPDLALLAHDLLAQPLLAKIVRSPSAVLPLPGARDGHVWLYNNNGLFRLRYPGVDGVKTGYTDAAGHCLVAAAHHGPTRLLVVLLHSPDAPSQAVKLLNAGFAALTAR